MIYISWEDIHESAKELAANVLESDFEPDYIIGIGNSGLTHAVLISKILKIPMIPFGVSSYSGKTRNEPVITVEPKINLSEKNLLVVDDIVATGQTFKLMKEILLDKYNAKSVRTAAAYLSLLVCKNYPDFYSRTYMRKPDEWILFPWDDPSDFD